MRNTLDLLAPFAADHRDRRNITVHLLGVPLSVLGLGVLLGRPSFDFLGLQLSPAWIGFALMAAWYLRRDLTLGAATSVGVACLLLLAQPLAAAGGVLAWLAWGLGLFLAGWLTQFLGHYYEGRRPALLDDLASLSVAPMFVTAEILFQAGWNRPLLDSLEARVGPTVLRDLAHPA
jgi:uncharacterized membrane protein YGL010W